MIHVYHGDGKGKTTASIGLAVRAAGSRMKVLFVQFLKTEFSGERHTLSHTENISLTFCPIELNFTYNMTEGEKAKAKINPVLGFPGGPVAKAPGFHCRGFDP